MRYMIAVLTYGWVLVGVVEDDHEEALVFLRAAVLRRFGTDKGLGQLAHGPTPQTQWDPIAMRVRVPRASVVYTIEATGWECLESDATPEVRRAARAR